MHICKAIASEDKDHKEEEESENDDNYHLRRPNQPPEFCDSYINCQSICHVSVSALNNLIMVSYTRCFCIVPELNTFSKC